MFNMAINWSMLSKSDQSEGETCAQEPIQAIESPSDQAVISIDTSEHTKL